MNYVIDGTNYVFEKNNQHNLEHLRNRLKFIHQFLFLEQHDRAIADSSFNEKILDNDEAKTALLEVSDYDQKNMLLYAFHYILEVTDFEEIGATPCSGTSTDEYSLNDQIYNGGELSFAELAYENDWNVISLNDLNVDQIKGTVLKNRDDSKNIFSISCEKQYYLCKSVSDKLCDLRFYQSFDNVSCVHNCEISDWTSLSSIERFKVLSTFYKEIDFIIKNDYSQVGRCPGKNPNRVESLSQIVKNCFEYRLLNPNYRIYFLKKSGQVVILFGRLKREAEITNAIQNKIKSLASNT